jgi:hypothetical protein
MWSEIAGTAACDAAPAFQLHIIRDVTSVIHQDANRCARPAAEHKQNRHPEKGSDWSFSWHSRASESMPFLPSTAPIATRMRICGVI